MDVDETVGPNNIPIAMDQRNGLPNTSDCLTKSVATQD